MIKALAFNEKRSVAVSSQWTGSKALHVWDIKSGNMLGTLNGHKSTANAVIITDDGKYAISGGNDRTLRVWDLCLMKEIYLHYMEGPVFDIKPIMSNGLFTVVFEGCSKILKLKTHEHA